MVLQSPRGKEFRLLKAKLTGALLLVALLGGCGGEARPSQMGSPSPLSGLCQSPDQAGCAECCVEQPGPRPEDLVCNRRRAADARVAAQGTPEYGQAVFLKLGPCSAACRPCAACTSDRRRSYQLLLSKGCDCLDPFVRDATKSIDPCFSDGCGCTCSQLSELSECGPPA